MTSQTIFFSNSTTLENGLENISFSTIVRTQKSEFLFISPLLTDLYKLYKLNIINNDNLVDIKYLWDSLVDIKY